MKIRLGLAMFLACLLGTGLAHSGQVTISFMNWSTTEEVYKPLFGVIEDFERENPDIKIKNVPISVGEIRNQFTVMNLGGNPPDVAQLLIGDAVYVYYTDALSPAEELYDKAFIDNLNEFFYAEAEVQGKHAGIVWGPQTLTFYYNKKLLNQLGYDKPPETLEEMEAMMKKGKETIPDLVGFQVDTTIRTLGFSHIWSFMNTFEYEVIKGKTVKFNSPGMVQFGEWIRRMINEGYTLPGKRFGEFRPLAAQGRVLFCYDSSHRSQIKSFRKDLTDEEYEAIWIPAPLPAGPTGRHLASPDDHTLVVSNKSKNKEAAAKFVKYLVESKSVLTKYHDHAGFLPPVKNYAEIAPGAFQDQARQGTLKYAVPNIVNLPYGPRFVNVATEVMTAIQEIITTDKPVKSILDAYQPKLEGILK